VRAGIVALATHEDSNLLNVRANRSSRRSRLRVAQDQGSEPRLSPPQETAPRVPHGESYSRQANLPDLLFDGAPIGARWSGLQLFRDVSRSSAARSRTPATTTASGERNRERARPVAPRRPRKSPRRGTNSSLTRTESFTRIHVLAYRSGRTAATNETAGYLIHGFSSASLHVIAGGNRQSACHSTGSPFALALEARSAMSRSCRR